jgi:hypothetical protein
MRQQQAGVYSIDKLYGQRMKLPNHDSVELEIPNPHVLDSAEQFYDGASVLNEMPPGSGVLLPFLTTAVLAMELYIKSMTSWSVTKDYQDYGNGVSGGIVSAEPQQRGHELSNLLNSVLPEVKDNINALHSKKVIECNFDGLIEQVKKYDRLFVDVRYSYENECLKDLNLSELWSSVKLLRLVVNSIDYKNYVYKRTI